MCLMVLNWRPDADWPLLLVANRDEFRDRPAKAMHWWPGAQTQDQKTHNDLLAGKDLKAGGTWLALGQSGHFALLTNIRPGYVGKTSRLSRGEIPLNFLRSSLSIERFHRELRKDIAAYGGFNLVLGDGNRLFWFSSDHPEGHWLTPGIHTLSNDALNTPWPKTEKARQQMAEQTQAFEQGDPAELGILADQAAAPDETLPSTGIPLEWERQLSAQTIIGEQYGTRCRTWLRMDRHGFIGVKEVQLNEQGATKEHRDFIWRISD